MQNAIYRGVVKHHRIVPKKHFFSYKTGMFCIDLNQISEVTDKSIFISRSRFNLITFNEDDYLPGYDGDLFTRLRNAVKKEGSNKNISKAFILTNLRFLGFCYNPVSFYYCYDSKDNLNHIVAEVNNTPWNERYIYVLDCSSEGEHMNFETHKEFHISPFMPMNLNYKWHFRNERSNILININTYKNNEHIFTATLKLEKKDINSSEVARSIFLEMFMSQRVKFYIYWQALKMWIKGFPVFNHPGKNNVKQ